MNGSLSHRLTRLFDSWSVSSYISATFLGGMMVFYNCIIVPILAFILTFSGRMTGHYVYGYAAEQTTSLYVLLLVELLLGLTLAAEAFVLIKLVTRRNYKGLIVGTIVSSLSLPLALFAFTVAYVLGRC